MIKGLEKSPILFILFGKMSYVINFFSTIRNFLLI